MARHGVYTVRFYEAVYKTWCYNEAPKWFLPLIESWKQIGFNPCEKLPHPRSIQTQFRFKSSSSSSSSSSVPTSASHGAGLGMRIIDLEPDPSASHGAGLGMRIIDLEADLPEANVAPMDKAILAIRSIKEREMQARS